MIRHLDFALHKRDRIGLVAPNGSGKTTLLHLILGLLKPSEGEVRLFGRSMRGEKDFVLLRTKIGLLFQDADDQLFNPTVIEDVAFGPLNTGKTREEALAISRDTLHRLGLSGFEDRITHKLSGGEKQMVAMATIVALQPEALLLDEPTVGLDEKTHKRLIALLAELALPCVIISHAFDFLSATTDRILTMENGRIVLDEEMRVHIHEHAHKLGSKPHRHV